MTADPDRPSSTPAPDDVSVREARPDELPAVLGVLDAGVLETDADSVRASIERGDVFVAVRRSEERADGTSDDPADGAERDRPLLGALVLDGAEITAVAVRRRRRGQGIGTALVGGAERRRDRLVATFDANVRPFYESLGFAVEPAGEPDRYRGRKPAPE
jgi:GNAT superfamily N-acetyltransferase